LYEVSSPIHLALPCQASQTGLEHLNGNMVEHHPLVHWGGNNV